jgi:hypothetical protein
MSIYDDSSDMVTTVKQKADELSRVASEFVEVFEQKVKEKERSLDKAIKKYQLLGLKEIKLKKMEDSLVEREKLLHKEKLALRDKKSMLTKKEEEVQEKLKRVQSLLTE